MMNTSIEQMDRLTLEAKFKEVEAELRELISAAKEAIPESEHPKYETASNWAWQIRKLGADRRAMIETTRKNFTT